MRRAQEPDFGGEILDATHLQHLANLLRETAVRNKSKGLSKDLSGHLHFSHPGFCLKHGTCHDHEEGARISTETEERTGENEWRSPFRDLVSAPWERGDARPLTSGIHPRTTLDEDAFLPSPNNGGYYGQAIWESISRNSAESAYPRPVTLRTPDYQNIPTEQLYPGRAIPLDSN